MIEVESHQKIGGLLKETVFGFNDGLVSTFAVIAGLTGGLIENKIVLLAALATLFAGAFSMGLGTYLGSKAEKDLYESERKRELWEMDNIPDAERQEIRDIYIAKGFNGQLLEDVVAKITGNREIWLQTMMTEELGFAQAPPKPGLNGIVMGISFIAGSLIPTAPYFYSNSAIVEKFNVPLVFAVSLGLSVFGLLVAGAVKTRFTGVNVLISALESLGIGALAAAASYGIGYLLT